MTINVENLVRMLGLAISNASIYGAEHAVTRQSVDACYEELQKVGGERDVAISISEDGIISVNDIPVEPKNRLIQHFSDHLEARDVSHMIIKNDMSMEQFEAFMDVLNAKPEELQQLGGVMGALDVVGLSGKVTTRKVVYREVAEDEVVVAKQAMGQHGAKPEDGSTDSGDGRSAEALMAIMRGEEPEDAAIAGGLIRDMRGDPDHLADLIAMAVKGVASDDPAAVVPDQLVAALQWVYQVMSDDPSFRTQKTKKQVLRTMQQLEIKLLKQLPDTGDGEGDVYPEVESAIKDTLESITDELTLDSLAQEYAKRCNAMISSEERITRYLKNKGPEALMDSELEQLLKESGLDDASWNELLVKSGFGAEEDASPPPASDGVGGGSAPDRAMDGEGWLGMQEMSALLGGIAAQYSEKDNRHISEFGVGTVDENIAGGSMPDQAGILETDLQAVRALVEASVLHAGQRIQQLVEDAIESDERKPRLSRKRLFEILAEIGQELCQPLAVINCSIDLVRGGSLGPVEQVQKEMLNAASDSGGKLKTLIDQLISIAGTPGDFAVDKKLQASFYT